MTRRLALVLVPVVAVAWLGVRAVQAFDVDRLVADTQPSSPPQTR